jgi:aspartate-semialdehyde dehydrogenase
VESPHSLELMETAVERHLASLLAGRASRTPMPSLRLVQAPVFHGYSISAWVELEEEAEEEAALGALAADRIDIRATAEDAPTNVGAAGTDGIIVGNVRRDRNIRRAFWFWIVTDNLRMSAGNAVELVKQICAV